MNTQKLQDRLRQLIKAKGLKLKEFSKITGIPYPTLLNYLQGNRKPTSNNLQKIAMHLNCSLNWLLTGEGEMFESPPIKNLIPVRVIPVLGKVPAGIPDIVEENIIEYIHCPEAPENSYAVIAKGESMAPTIRDGDYIIFIFDGNIISGDIIIVNNEWGETMLKRYREKEGKIFLTSDNPEYPIITPNEHYKIIGKVVAVWRRIKI